MFEVSVVIPVGPHPSNTRWLQYSLDSIVEQTMKPVEVLIINDSFNTYCNGLFRDKFNLRVYTPPWRLGVGHAFNFGVALAETECVLMLGSDDTLEPEAVEQCMACYEAHERADAYYAMAVKYMNSGQEQWTPCNAAMVTKGFWEYTGGFPIEATTAPDAALLSICLAHKLPVFPVGSKPLYNYRDHDETDTVRHAAWMQTIIDIRHLVTLEWAPRI